jgi:hypothetical protein
MTAAAITERCLPADIELPFVDLLPCGLGPLVTSTAGTVNRDLRVLNGSRAVSSDVVDEGGAGSTDARGSAARGLAERSIGATA